MKSKTIKAILGKKFNDFVSSIKDEEVKKLVQKNSIITGGCIPSMLLKKKVNDFDIYFTNKKTALAVSKYYVKEFNATNNLINKIGYEASAFVLDGAKPIEAQLPENWNWGSRMINNLTEDRVKIIVRSDGVASEQTQEAYIDTQIEDLIAEADSIPAQHLEDEDGKERYRPIFLSTNAITLSNKIQLIIRFYGAPEEIHSNYDFIHVTNYWLSDSGNLTLNKEALESLLSKELRYFGSKYPLCSVIRTRKYINRGWTINAGQYLKMCFQISELDLHDIDVLEDQLVGVDSIYFMQLIDALRQQKERQPDFNYSYGYITSIIDRIF